MKSPYANTESLVIGVLLAFPLFGTFMPFEIYIQPLTFESVYFQERVETYGFSHIIFLGIMTLCGYLMLVYGRAMLREVWRAPFLFLLLAFSFASLTWSADPGTTMRRALRLLEYSIFGFYLFYKFDIAGFSRYITRVLAIPVFASFAILVVRPDLGYSNLQGYHDAVRGALVNKNGLGGLMSIAMLVAGYSLLIRANNRIFAGVVLVGSFVLLLLSRSATANLAAFATIGLGLYGWIVRRRANAGWGIMGAILTFLGVGALIFGSIYLSEAGKVVGRSATFSGRTDVWRAVLEAIRHRPLLGYGYGFWEIPGTVRNNIWMEVNWAPPHAHNGWLDAMLQLGIVGLFITGMLWVVSLSRAIRFALFTREAGALFVGLIVVNMFIRNLTETVMLDPGESDWLWFVVAYLHLTHIAQAHKQPLPIPAAVAISA